MRIDVNKHWPVYLDFGCAGSLSLQLYWTYHRSLHMRIAVKNHALPVYYKKNRIASLLCIFESTIPSVSYASARSQYQKLYSFKASDAKSDVRLRMPVCPWFGFFCKTSEVFWIQTICKLWKAGERERERERETSACCIIISCYLEKKLRIGTENDNSRCLSCASAFASRQYWCFACFLSHAKNV